MSDVKILFRYIQAAHHRGHVSQTPKGLLKMQSKLDSFIKVAAPCPKTSSRVRDINASWAKDQATAMQAHYIDLMSAVKTNILSRQFTADSFEKAWLGAVKWARSSLGRKLAPGTLEAARASCRADALAKPATLVGPPAPKQTLKEPSVPSHAVTSKQTSHEPVQSTGEWKFVSYDRRYSQPTEWRLVSGPKDPLSNFFAFKFRYRGLDHKSVEHAYHMEKAQHFKHMTAWRDIEAARDAFEAKHISNSYFKGKAFKQACRNRLELAQLCKSWDSGRETLVLHLLRLKLEQCPRFTNALRESGTKSLLHNVLDSWWGTGSRGSDILGVNVFGRLLEQVRREKFGLVTQTKVGRNQAARPEPPESVTHKGEQASKAPEVREQAQTKAKVGRNQATGSEPPMPQKQVGRNQAARPEPPESVTCKGEQAPKAPEVKESKQTESQVGRNQTTGSEPPKHSGASSKSDAGRSQATQLELHRPPVLEKANPVTKDKELVSSKVDKRKRGDELQDSFNHETESPQSPDLTPKRPRGQEVDNGTSPELMPGNGDRSKRLQESTTDGAGSLTVTTVHSERANIMSNQVSYLKSTGVPDIGELIDTPSLNREAGLGVSVDMDTSRIDSESGQGVRDSFLSPVSSPILQSEASLADCSVSSTASISYAMVVSSPPALTSSHKKISSSQPCLTSFLGLKTAKVSLTELKSTHHGEAYVKSSMVRIEPPNRNKDLWELPQVTRSTVIIGDSNLSNMKQVRESRSAKIQLVSYPGAKVEHLYNILKKQKEPLNHVSNLILNIGINNRSQSAHLTTNKHIKSLHFQIKRVFPNSKLYYAAIGNKLSSFKEMQNLRDFEKTWRSFHVNIISSLPVTRTTPDGIHWTPETARCLLDHWLDHLDLN